MEKLLCVQCGNNHIVKCGIRNSIQRYQCRNCKVRFQMNYKYKRTDKEKQKQALELYLEGLGLRSIGRYLKVSHVSVLNWIRSIDIVSWTRPSHVKAIEIDEVFFYVGNKNENAGCSLRYAVRVNVSLRIRLVNGIDQR